MTQLTLSREVFIDIAQSDRHDRTGYIILNSSETIDLDKISGCIFLECRGRMSSKKSMVLSFPIQSHKRLTKDTTYNIPFSFKLPESGVDSYKGRNVTFSYNCEVQIEVNDNDDSKVERSFLTKVKSFVTADTSIKTTKYFNVENSIMKYQVVNETKDFSLQHNWILSVVLVAICGPLYALCIPDYSTYFIIMGIILMILIAYLSHLTIESLIGIVTMEVSNDDESFLCKLSSSKEIKLSNQSIYYEIIEKVIDKRGTSSVTYKERVFLSKSQEIPSRHVDAALKYSFPERLGLQSFNYNDASLIWEMNIEGDYLGLDFHYNCVFRVRKK